MNVITPVEPYASDPFKLLALCIWREARGESYEAKLGVAWTIKNRCSQAPKEGFKPDIAGNILKPWAFSSFMEGDPNSVKYPAETDPSWQFSMTAAIDPAADPTNKAVFYYSLPLTAPPKAWGEVGKHIEHSATIGGLEFYRLIS